MIYINQFNALIHPDYQAIYDGQTKLHHLQQTLRDEWMKYVANIAERPNSALIYVTVLDVKELSNGFRDPNSLDHPGKQEDLERIHQHQQLLGERMILVPNHFPVTHRLLMGTSGDKIKYTPNETELLVMGEYYGGGISCVESWGEKIRTSLDISVTNYHVLEELCFTVNSIKEVSDWYFRTTRETQQPSRLERFY